MRIKLLILTLLFAFLGARPVYASSIKINEFYSEGTSSSNPDWVEIYKEGIDISLYQLIDAVNNKQDLDTAICNGNFCYADWSNRLNKDGDTIRLELKSSPGQSVDQVVYGSSGDISPPGVEQSAGRNPDATGGWVIFSSPTKGTANNTSTVSPSPSPSPSTSSSPSPTSSPSSSSSTSSSSSFTISNIPSKIDSTETFSASINLSLPNSTNTTFYLKGAFKKKDGNNYFGLTKVGSSWIKNNQTYSDQYKITTNSSGSWNGNLEIQPDILDSGYEGSGDYIFKVGRYTDSGSLNWSNEININIVAQEITMGDEDEKDAEVLGTSQAKEAKEKKISYDEISLEKYVKVASSISAVVSPTPETEVKGERKINIFSIAGTILVIIGSGALVYAVYNYIQRRNNELG